VQLIGPELKIGRTGERDELRKKGADIGGPEATMRPATGFGVKRIPPAQPRGAQFVEPGFGDAELRGSRGRVEVASIEVGKNAADKLGRKAVEELLLFIPTNYTAPRTCRSKNAQRGTLASPSVVGRCTSSICRVANFSSVALGGSPVALGRSRALRVTCKA
jgi:hypothetical protein